MLQALLISLFTPGILFLVHINDLAATPSNVWKYAAVMPARCMLCRLHQNAGFSNYLYWVSWLRTGTVEALHV